MESNSLYISKHVDISHGIVNTNGKIPDGLETGEGFRAFSRMLYKSMKCNYSKFYKMDNLCKLAFLAAELLVRDESLSFPPENTALLLANSGSTIDTDKNFVNTLDKIPSPAIFVYTLPNIAVGELSIRHGWKGENLFLITDRFDPEIFRNTLFMLFANSNTKVCVTGWIDYYSDDNYRASIWSITDEADVNFRRLETVELFNDFNIRR